MKKHLTSTEYRKIEDLVNHILTASTKEETVTYIKSLEGIRNRGYHGSIKSILSELCFSLKIISDRQLLNNERLSYFAFADSHLSKLKNYIRDEEPPL